MARFILVLRWILQGSGEDCGVVSDCEELVGVTHRRWCDLPEEIS